MSGYSTTILIYNPKSTGEAKVKADWLKAEIQRRIPKTNVELWPTESAGHAIELAEEAAKKYKQSLVVSVSGDGGYNEVINGAMRLPKDKRPICMVYPAGNANDHRRAIRERDFVEAIVEGKPKPLDLLRVSFGSTIRYAHSYVGLGITPVAAVELNRHTLNALMEAWVVFSTFWKYRPFKIEHRGKQKTLNSIVFANIAEMSKVLTLSEDGDPTDGKFEVITIPDVSKLRLIAVGLKAAFNSLSPQEVVKRYDFTTITKMPMQLDGEVVELKAREKVAIKIEPQAITTLA